MAGLQNHARFLRSQREPRKEDFFFLLCRSCKEAREEEEEEEEEKSLFASLCNSEGEEEGRKGAWNASAAKAAKKGSKRRKSFNIRGRAGMRSGWSEEEEVGASEAAKGRKGGRVRAVDKEEKTSGRDYTTATKREREAAGKKGKGGYIEEHEVPSSVIDIPYAIQSPTAELKSYACSTKKIVTRPTFRPPPPPPGPEETSSPPPPVTALSPPPPPPPMASLEVLCSDVERCFSPNSKRG